jgi:hypothetical protein
VSETTDNRLVAFLYVLGRDHVPLGVVNGFLKDTAALSGFVLSDPHLAAWARSRAIQLTRRMPA